VNAKPEFKGPRPPIPCVRIRQVYYSQAPAGGGVVTSTTTKAQSGVVIGNHRNGTGTVLTCAHGLDERGPVQLLILQSVVWGQIRALDRERDLAVIDCELPADYPPLRIANESPVVGTEVTIAGYGTGWWDFTYAEERTRILGKNEDPTRQGKKLLHIAAPTRHGDSGGPLVYNRELIGVHILGDDRTGWDVSVEEVNEFLVQKAGWKRRR
jgi:S1-C subfamily serine protease